MNGSMAAAHLNAVIGFLQWATLLQASVSMLTMMGVRKVSVCVSLWFVQMAMRVFGARRHRHLMHMLMMLVMGVFMGMLHDLMDMRMFMALSEMQPDTNGHQGSGHG